MVWYIFAACNVHCDLGIVLHVYTDIAMEKKLSQSEEPADSAHQEPRREKTNEQLDGFW